MECYKTILASSLCYSLSLHTIQSPSQSCEPGASIVLPQIFHHHLQKILYKFSYSRNL
jgi:hypothetical protein